MRRGSVSVCLLCHSRESGNPTEVDPRFREDDIKLIHYLRRCTPAPVSSASPRRSGSSPLGPVANRVLVVPRTATLSSGCPSSGIVHHWHPQHLEPQKVPRSLADCWRLRGARPMPPLAWQVPGPRDGVARRSTSRRPSFGVRPQSRHRGGLGGRGGIRRR